jgi:putative aminopeptidase FrvX
MRFTSAAPASYLARLCPLRYMHSLVELCELDDATNAARSIAAFAPPLQKPVEALLWGRDGLL